MGSIKILILWTGACLAVDPDIVERAKCTPRDRRVSIYPECMQGSNLILWCDYSNYTKIPDPDHIYQAKSCRNTLQLIVNDSCLQALTEDQLEKYQNIEVLHCGWNKIRILKGGVFRNNAKLRRIDMRRNYITHIERESFTGLHHLESLYLSSNLLEEVEGSAFAELESLQELSLHNNVIKALKKRTFSHLRHLKVLDLSGNEISSIEDGAFQGLDELETLHLDGNKISEINTPMLESLPNLQVLTLSHNDLQSFSLFPNGSFPQMHTLDLSHNYIQSLGDFVLSRMPKLQTLKMEYNEIRSIHEDAFRNNKELRVVDLSANNLTEIARYMFSNSCHLEELNLSDNEIKNFYLDWYSSVIRNGHPIGNDVRRNEWECTCDIYLLKQVLRDKQAWIRMLDFNCWPDEDEEVINAKCKETPTRMSAFRHCQRRKTTKTFRRHVYEAAYDSSLVRKQMKLPTPLSRGKIKSLSYEAPSQLRRTVIVSACLATIFLIVLAAVVFKLKRLVMTPPKPQDNATKRRNNRSDMTMDFSA